MSRRTMVEVSEEQWRTYADPFPLFKRLRRGGNARKFLLLGCAIVRNWPGGVWTELGRGLLEDIEAFAKRPARPERDTRLVEDVLRRRSPDLPSEPGRDPGSNYRVRQLLGVDENWFAHFFTHAAAPSRTSGTLVNLLMGTMLWLSRRNTELAVVGEIADLRRTTAPAELSATQMRDAIRDRLPGKVGMKIATLPQARQRLRRHRWAQKGTEVKTLLSSLVRDALGDVVQPWHIHAEWLARHDGAVRDIAADIDRTGSFADMPVLGDALEDVGCQDAAVLEHCRSTEPHALGCWVLDAILRR